MPKEFSKSDLDNIIRNYLGLAPTVQLPGTIRKQLTRFIVEQNIPIIEIARAIAYYVEVLKYKIDSIHGIYFVPDVLNDSNKYFEKLAAEKAAKQQEAKKFSQSETKDEVIFNVNMKAIAERKIARKLEQLSFDTIDLSGGDNGRK